MNLHINCLHTHASCYNTYLCLVWRWWRGSDRSSSCSVPVCSRIPHSGAAAPPCRPLCAGSAPSEAECLETGWRCPHGPDSVRKRWEFSVTGCHSGERNEVWCIPCGAVMGKDAFLCIHQFYLRFLFCFRLHSKYQCLRLCVFSCFHYWWHGVVHLSEVHVLRSCEVEALLVALVL